MRQDNALDGARRAFLKQLGAGTAVISMPAFLAGCATFPAIPLSEPVPENPFLTWFGVDEQLLARVMSELTANGATLADLYFQHARNEHLRLEDGVAAAPQISIEQGAGLRVVNNGQTGFVATEVLTAEGLLAAARDAAAIATGSAAPAPSRFAILPGNDSYPVKTHWTDVSLDRRWHILEQVTECARTADSSVASVTVDWQDADERILIATLDGNLVTDRRPLTRLSVQVEVQRGAERHSGFASVSARRGVEWFARERLDELAKTAVERALVRFDARRPPLGEMPVVLAAGTSGIVLHEALGHALEADFSEPGGGPYAGRLGEQVAATFVSVIDDATMPHERGALNTDDEGIAGQRNVLIENGILKSFLHDRTTAAAAGVAPTGSGRRESFRYAPQPRMSCTFIANGTDTRDDVLDAAGRGVLVETYSDGKVDPRTGDFSFRIRNGSFIEGGKARYPLRDLTLHGNGPSLLANVQRLANDGRMDAAGWTCGKRGQRVPVSHGMPTALVGGLTIGD
ncbi:MAG: TldD/PmbA family protein [Woeseia sp.]